MIRQVGNPPSLRPSQFSLNPFSWQAQGLKFWIVAQNGRMCDMSAYELPVNDASQANIYRPAKNIGGIGANFNNSTRSINFPFKSPPSFTLVCWVITQTTNSGAFQAVIECGRGTNGAFGMWRDATSGYNFRWDQAAQAASFGTFVANTPTMLVGSWDGVNVRGYQNGVLRLSTTGTRAAPDQATAAIGVNTLAGEAWADNGVILEVRLYDYPWRDIQARSAYSASQRWDLYKVNKRVTTSAAVASTFLPRLAVLGAG